jgi:hypothetical protein
MPLLLYKKTTRIGLVTFLAINLIILLVAGAPASGQSLKNTEIGYPASGMQRLTQIPSILYQLFTRMPMAIPTATAAFFVLFVFDRY